MNAEEKRKTLNRLRRLTNLLDTSFTVPGLGYKVGLDALVGLIPGIGDLATLIPGLYIIFEGARLGVPRRVVLAMIFNTAFETLVGSIPIIGDIFDLFWKANVRNMRLIEKYVTQ